MIPQEVFENVRKIEIFTRHLVDSAFAGGYHSVFKGQGIEFEEVREYQPNDDIRNIDWNVTARMGKPFIKRFIEERELTVMLLVDVSASLHFGTRQKLKTELIAEFCATLAFSALTNNDRVGMLSFSDDVEHFIPPKRGRKHILRMISELLAFEPQGKGTNYGAAFRYLQNAAKGRKVVFLISDFIEHPDSRGLRILGLANDVIAVQVTDPAELELPSVGLVYMEDPETGEQLLIDSDNSAFRKRYNEEREQKEKAFKDLMESCKVDRISLRTDRTYVEPLISFFHERELRSRRT
jgi:uncharacterized protein (DUF58 family)